jgi:hypothetical protein
MSVDRALVVAASFGLFGAVPMDAELSSPDEITAVLSVVQRDRIQGLFAAAAMAGAVHGPGLPERAFAVHHDELSTSLLAEEAAVLAHDALGEIDVEVAALKGIASAHLDYADPAMRVFGDADLLVRTTDLGRALPVLEAAGFVRRRPAVRPWWERRYGRSVTMDAPNGSELDVHLRLAGGYFGARLDHGAIWSRAETSFTLGGRRFVALCPEDRLLHACCHAVLGNRSGLRAHRDVAQLVLVTGADWRRVVDRAAQAGAAVVIAAAVRASWDALALASHEVDAWACSHPVSVIDARMLAACQDAFQSDWTPEGRSVLSALGPVDRMLFLLGLAFPSRASLHARGRTRLGHVRERAGLLLRRG